MKEDWYKKLEDDELAKTIREKPWSQILDGRIDILKKQIARSDRVIEVMEERLRRNEGSGLFQQYKRELIPSAQEDLEKAFVELESLGQLDTSSYKSSMRKQIYFQSWLLVAAAVASVVAAFISAFRK